MFFLSGWGLTQIAPLIWGGDMLRGRRMVKPGSGGGDPVKRDTDPAGAPIVRGQTADTEPAGAAIVRGQAADTEPAGDTFRQVVQDEAQRDETDVALDEADVAPGDETLSDGD